MGCSAEDKRLKSKKDIRLAIYSSKTSSTTAYLSPKPSADTSKTVKEITTKYNLAYKNSTCQTVSEEVRSRLLKKSEPYESGETLVCRSWFKVKKQVFNVNYEYEITAVEGG